MLFALLRLEQRDGRVFVRRYSLAHVCHRHGHAHDVVSPLDELLGVFKLNNVFLFVGITPADDTLNLHRFDCRHVRHYATTFL